MTFFGKQSSIWLREMTAIAAGAVLISSLPATVARANTSSDALSFSETAAVESTVSQRSGSGFCVSNLNTALDTIVNRPQFASAIWGISVESLLDETVLYTHRSEDLLIPASNVKLLTTAAALRIITERRPQSLPTYRNRLEVINRYSDNALADELLRTIGGQLAVNRALEPLGVSPNDYWQADGSGLSRSNKIKPSALVTLLKAMHTTDESRIFYNSLPVGGVNGTLQNRFKGTALQGKVRAKTGTLNGVRALSGYVETSNYDTLAFSIVINQPGQSGGVMLDAIDEMVLQIARVSPCR